MELTFGARLREQRERQQVSLAAIAAATKIKLALLEELEADNVSHWPSGLYRRSYMRDYARAVGLDPEPAVREFLALYPDPLLVAEAAAETAAKAAAAARAPEARLKRLFGSLLPRPGKSEAESPSDEPAGGGMFPTDLVPAEADDRPHESFDLHLVKPERATDAPTAPPAINLSVLAGLCTRLACAVDCSDVAPVLSQTASLLEATGLIVWAWDARRRVLAPSLAHGYADAMLQTLPGVPADAPNAIATAFRTTESCTVDGSGDATGALVVPMMAARGCIGVVALELRDGRERDETVRSAAEILAAQLATLLDIPPVTEAATA